MAGLFGNLLINGKTTGFSSPEQLIELLILNNALDEFLEMIEKTREEFVE